MMTPDKKKKKKKKKFRQAENLTCLSSGQAHFLNSNAALMKYIFFYFP